MTRMQDLKTKIWHAFYRMIPKKYYSRIIPELQQLAFTPLDYDKHEILMAQGVMDTWCRGEPELVKWLETALKPGQVFYDIGSNVGTCALIAAKYHQHKVKVYAFEPAATTVLIL